MAVLLLIDRPGLEDALRLHGVPLAGAEEAPTLLIAPAAHRASLSVRFPGVKLLAVTHDAAEEREALHAGVADVASADDDVIAVRAARLLAPDGWWHVGELAIDRVARRATRAGRPLTLLPREYAMLVHLARHAGRTVPHAELRRAVFGLAFDPGTNLLAVHASRLRAALDRGFAWSMLHTDRGRGYRLVATPPASG